MIRQLILPLMSHDGLNKSNQGLLIYNISSSFCKSLRSSSAELTFESPCVTSVLKAAFDTHLAVRTIVSIALWEWNLVNRKLDCPQGLALSFKQPLRCDTLLYPCVEKKTAGHKTSVCEFVREHVLLSEHHR